MSKASTPEAARKCAEQLRWWVNNTSGHPDELMTASALNLSGLADENERLRAALQGLLAGNTWCCLQGEWAWHTKQLPSNEALTAAREALDPPAF